jgi:hypothetical protein
MVRPIFFGSIVLCVLFVGLSQMPDPSFFGIRDEPGRLLYYAGTGFLAGLFGLVTAIIGIYNIVSNSGDVTQNQRRVVLVALSVVVVAAIVAFVIRSGPIL